MNGGDLRAVVQLLRSTPVDDGFTKKDVFAAQGDPIRARKRDLSDGERFRAGEVAGHVTTRFTVRRSAFTDAITPKDRLDCDGVTYEITGVKDVGDGRMWREITCAARTDT